MQNQNRQSSIYHYFSNNMIHTPLNNGNISGSLNFRSVQHFSQNDLINVENTIIKKLDKILNKCDNKESF